MKNNIHYSLAAQRDLDEIWEHIASELQNTSAAKRTVDRIMDDVDQLESFAEIGTLLSSVADIQSDYRFLLTAPTPYGVGFQEGLPAPRSVGYAAILKPQGHLAAA